MEKITIETVTGYDHTQGTDWVDLTFEVLEITPTTLSGKKFFKYGHNGGLFREEELKFSSKEEMKDFLLKSPHYEDWEKKVRLLESLS